jgi:predicted naringenin-chalcone synthase
MKNHHPSPGVVLADFFPIEPTAPVPQEKVRHLIEWAMAKAKCIELGITSDAEANAVFEKVKAKIRRYWISSAHIKHRRMLLLASYSGDDATSTQLKVNGAFSDAEGYSPLYHDFIKNHTSPHGADIGHRMELHDKICTLCLNKLYKDTPQPPDDIIHVTNSGYSAPSPVETLVSRKEWFNTTVTHSYDMGCYGSLPAIRMAHGFLSSSFFGITRPKSHIDIFHSELYSTHTNIADDSAENIVVLSLFGDGIVKYSAYTEDEARKSGLTGLKILALKENLLPNSTKDMAAIPGPYNFQMTLSIRVPMLIRASVKNFVTSVFEVLKKDFNREKDNIVYAIHPGGPAIIEHICKELGLTAKQVALSTKTIYENGNISSATLPYMFHQIVNSDDISAGTIVLGLAFGPGLTISAIILEKVVLDK